LNGEKGIQRWLKPIRRVPLIKKPELLNGIVKETQELIKILVTNIKTAVQQAQGPERSRRAEKRQKQAVKFDIGFFIRFYNNLSSEATSLFDVRCSMFDVGRSSFYMLDVHLLKQARMA